LLLQGLEVPGQGSGDSSLLGKPKTPAGDIPRAPGKSLRRKSSEKAVMDVGSGAADSQLWLSAKAPLQLKLQPVIFVAEALTLRCDVRN